jgi:hypothetical protein
VPYTKQLKKNTHTQRGKRIAKENNKKSKPELH